MIFFFNHEGVVRGESSPYSFHWSLVMDLNLRCEIELKFSKSKKNEIKTVLLSNSPMQMISISPN